LGLTSRRRDNSPQKAWFPFEPFAIQTLDLAHHI